MTTVYAIQGDTLDSISTSYFPNNPVQVLADLIELNPTLESVILVEHQAVVLPESITTSTTQTLKLWD
jgi:phage tail protein X